MSIDQAKEAAALAALAEVRSGMKLGLGTGSTVYWLLLHLGRALASGTLEKVAGVPTSIDTERRCREFGIPLLELAAHPVLDLAIDGADEIDPQLDLIKGLGGALLREKMVATAAQRFLVIADESKLVERLGEKAPLPVEVVRFAADSHLPFLRSAGASPTLRQEKGGSGPFLTDNSAVIWDCRFERGIPDPLALGSSLDARPGILDHGLFLGLADVAYVATPLGVRVLRRPDC